jgi:hypothetical protein
MVLPAFAVREWVHIQHTGNSDAEAQSQCYRCVVIEDSVIGLQAAKAAGMRCIVTKSRYTENERFDSADAIFDCIGDAGDERFSLDDLLTPGTANAPSPPKQAATLSCL